jgi:hypothetical protein
MESKPKGRGESKSTSFVEKNSVPLCRKKLSAITCHYFDEEKDDLTAKCC